MGLLNERREFEIWTRTRGGHAACVRACLIRDRMVTVSMMHCIGSSGHAMALHCFALGPVCLSRIRVGY